MSVVTTVSEEPTQMVRPRQAPNRYRRGAGRWVVLAVVVIMRRVEDRSTITHTS
jgi:hypothetical protein